MVGCSNNRAEAFAAVTPSQILALMEILQQTALRKRSFVALRYKERAGNFDETLAFLEAIEWVTRVGDELQPAAGPLFRFAQTPANEKRWALAEMLTDCAGSHRHYLASYLTRFEPRGPELVYRPVGEEQFEQSAARDFLMELGIVAHRPHLNHYVVNARFAGFYFWARNVTGPNGESLARRQSDRADIGREAELAVFEFERRRLGATWDTHVRHVAAEFPAACFDIKSLTVEDAMLSPRFIEVKAVPANSLQFYWTAAELEAARMIGQEFFLYLVPVIERGCLDMRNLQIIRDPYVAVYQKPEWMKEENVVVCRRA